MARVKRGVPAHKRHKRLLAQAEGRRGTRSKLVRPAREALFHALVARGKAPVALAEAEPTEQSTDAKDEDPQGNGQAL